MANPLAVMTKISNLIEIIHKYKIPRENYEDIVKSETIEIPIINLPLAEHKKISEWVMIKYQVKDYLRQVISNTDKLKSFLVVELHLDELATSIANVIINQIEKSSNERTCLELWFRDEFNESFNYFQTFKATSDEGIAEYLEVTAEGALIRTEKMFSSTDYLYELTAKLKIRAINVNFTLSPSEDIKAFGPQILCELKWYGNEIKSLNCSGGYRSTEGPSLPPQGSGGCRSVKAQGAEKILRPSLPPQGSGGYRSIKAQGAEEILRPSLPSQGSGEYRSVEAQGAEKILDPSLPPQ